MSYADAKQYLFDEALPFARREIDNALKATAGTVDGIDELIEFVGTSGSTVLPQAIKTGVLTPAAITRRLQQAGMLEPLQGIVNSALAWVGQEIDSSHVDGANANPAGVLFDLADRMDTDDDYVAPRGTTFAPDTAGGSGLLMRRLLVDHRGFTLDGGVRETVTYEVTRTELTGAGAKRVTGILYGLDGPDDALDYRGKGTARGNNVEVTLTSIQNPGGISNAAFNVSGTPANSDAIPLAGTNLAVWRQTNVGSEATVVFRNTNQFRGKAGGLAISGQDTGRRFEQDFVVPAAQGGEPSAYTPIDIITVVYWDGTWQGSIKQVWGNKDQTFTHSSFSGAGFKYLLPDLDKDLYPVNHSVTDPKFAIEVATTSVGGELVLHYADVQRMVARNGIYYSGWSHTADPVERYKVTWADTCTYAGEFNDTLNVLYGQAGWAYLPTSGSNLISPPVLTPAIGIAPSGGVVDPGGTTAPFSVTYTLTNTGRAPAAINVPTQGAVTNAVLSAAGLAASRVLMPGKSLAITVEADPTTTGAWSVVVQFTGNFTQIDRTITGTVV